jgi:hypothetical protein
VPLVVWWYKFNIAFNECAGFFFRVSSTYPDAGGNMLSRTVGEFIPKFMASSQGDIL